MTTKPCDHTSVGVLVFREGKLLLIDRAKPPFGLAAPAGHVDEHGDPGDGEDVRNEKAAAAELLEETGLRALSLSLVAEGRKDTACRRPGGDWHYWRIYEAETSGTVSDNETEVRGHVWCDRDAMEKLLADEESPYGTLEPVWKTWFGEMDILSRFPKE